MLNIQLQSVYTKDNMHNMFSSRIIVNITEFDDTVVQSERYSAIKPGLIQHFLH